MTSTTDDPPPAAPASGYGDQPGDLDVDRHEPSGSETEPDRDAWAEMFRGSGDDQTDEERWGDLDVQAVVAQLPRGDRPPRLDDVEWGRLRHTYGSAADVPALLTRVSDPDPAAASQALGVLWNNLRHQGGTSMAAPLTVPFLIRLAADPDVCHRWNLLDLAAEIARRNHFGRDSRCDLLQAADDEQRYDNWGYPGHWSVQAGRDALAPDTAILLSLLHDPGPHVRCRAAYALAAASDHPAEITDGLRQRLGSETEPSVRISLLLGIAQTAREHHHHQLDATTTWLHGLWSDPAQPLDIRLGAAIAWLCLTDAPPPDGLLDPLADAATPEAHEWMRHLPWPDDIDDHGGLGAWPVALLRADTPGPDTALTLRLATSPHPQTRIAAIRAAALDHDDEVRAWATVGLAHCGDHRSIQPLAHLFGQDRCPWPSGNAYGANLRMPARLLDALRPHAAQLLPALIERLGEAGDGWSPLANDLVRGLGCWGPDAGPAARAIATSLLRGPLDTPTVATALGRIGPAAADLIPVLDPPPHSADDATRAVLAWACWRISGERNASTVVATLTRAATTPSYGYRALRMLADLGPAAPSSVDTVRALLLADGDAAIRVEAAHTMWRITGDHTDVLPVLLNVLQRSTNTSGRTNSIGVTAMQYLADLGQPAPDAVPGLHAVLHSDERVGGSGAHDTGHDEFTWDQHVQQVAAHPDPHPARHHRITAQKPPRRTSAGRKTDGPTVRSGLHDGSGGMTAGPFDPDRHHARPARPPRELGRADPDRAWCLTYDSHDDELVSGYGDRLSGLALAYLRALRVVDDRHIPEVAAHVEMKAALWMREHAAERPDVVLPGIPCVGPLSCATLLSTVPPAWTRQPLDDPDGYTVVAYWRHDHGQDPVVARTPADANHLIDRLLAEPFGHSVAALYVMQRPLSRVGLPDHELRIAVNAAGDTGGLRYMGGPGTWFSAGAVSRHEHLCYHHMGWAAPFPRDSELPVHQIRAAVVEFMTSGGQRPACVTWQRLTLPTGPP